MFAYDLSSDTFQQAYRTFLPEIEQESETDALYAQVLHLMNAIDALVTNYRVQSRLLQQQQQQQQQQDGSKKGGSNNDSQQLPNTLLLLHDTRANLFSLISRLLSIMPFCGRQTWIYRNAMTNALSCKDYDLNRYFYVELVALFHLEEEEAAKEATLQQPSSSAATTTPSITAVQLLDVLTQVSAHLIGTGGGHKLRRIFLLRSSNDLSSSSSALPTGETTYHVKKNVLSSKNNNSTGSRVGNYENIGVRSSSSGSSSAFTVFSPSVWDKKCAISDAGAKEEANSLYHTTGSMCLYVQEVGNANDVGGLLWPAAIDLSQRIAWGSGPYSICHPTSSSIISAASPSLSHATSATATATASPTSSILHQRCNWLAGKRVLEVGCGIAPLPSTTIAKLLLESADDKTHHTSLRIGETTVCASPLKEEMTELVMTDYKPELFPQARACFQRGVLASLNQHKYNQQQQQQQQEEQQQQQQQQQQECDGPSDCYATRAPELSQTEEEQKIFRGACDSQQMHGSGSTIASTAVNANGEKNDQEEEKEENVVVATLGNVRVQASFCCLDWGNIIAPSTTLLPGSFDVIVGADLLYEERAVLQIFKVLCRFLRPARDECPQNDPSSAQRCHANKNEQEEKQHQQQHHQQRQQQGNPHNIYANLPLAFICLGSRTRSRIDEFEKQMSLRFQTLCKERFHPGDEVLETTNYVFTWNCI